MGDPPEFLFPQHQLLQVIAEGGMSRVYKARREDGTTVALKVPKAESLEEEGMRRFLSTARRWVKLEPHPHIAQALGLVGPEGQPALEMELVEGETLEKALTGGPFEISRALRIASQLTDALEAVHAAGLIHRDLKPANVILTPAGAKLVDFGIALPTLSMDGSDPTRLTSTGVVIGTPAYMSPEQAAGKRDLTPASDVFVLGSLLFEMLSGAPPFTHADSLGVLRKLADPGLPAPDLKARVPAVPDALAQLVAQLLDKDRTRRPRELSQVRARLADRTAPTGFTGSSSHTNAKASSSSTFDLGKRIIGRKKAVATAEEALLALASGRGGFLVLTGEMGIGKKRLAREMGIAARERGAGVLRGSGVRPEGRSFRPVYQALSAWCRQRRIRDQQDLSRTLAQLSPHLEGWSDLLATFLHLPAAGARVTGGEGPGLLDALEALLLSLAEDAPLLLSLENLEKVDEGTLDLLRYLVPILESRPLLILGTMQPELLPASIEETMNALRAEGHLHLQEMPRLTLPEAAELVAERYPGLEDDPDLLHRLHQLSGGNPLFLLSALDEMAGSGAVRLEGRFWRLAMDLSPSLLPHKILDLLSLRVRRLDEGQRKLFDSLALAAGPQNREVDPGLLESLLEQSVSEIRGHLSQLVEKQGLAERDSGRYRLAHPALHEVAVRLLDPALRAEIERRLGHALVDWQESEPDQVAHHLWTGREYAAAVPYLRRAADRYLELEDNQQAEELYRRWSQIEPEDTGARLGLAHARLNQGLHVAALEEFREASRLARLREEKDKLARSTLGIAHAQRACGDYEAARGSVLQARKIFADLGDSKELANCAALLGSVEHHSGNLDAALEAYQAALAYYEQEDPLQAARVRLLMARMELLGGNPEKALASYRSAGEVYAALGNRRYQATAVNNEGIVLTSLGKFEEARACFNSALDLRRQVSDRRGVAATTLHLAYLHSLLGLYEQAVDEALRAHSVFENLGEKGMELMSRITFGLASLRLGRREESYSQMRQAIDDAQRLEDREYAARARWSLLEWQLVFGRTEATVELLQDFSRDVEELELERFQPDLELLRGLLADDPEARLSHLQTAASLPELQSVENAWRVAAELGRCLESLGRPEEAGKAMAQAADHINQVAGGLKDPALRQVYLEEPRRAAVLADARRMTGGQASLDTLEAPQGQDPD